MPRTPLFRPFLAAAAALCLLTGPVRAEPADVAAPASSLAAPLWEMDKNQSHIVFKGSQMGKAFEGRFTDFNAEIRFSPDMLETSHVKVTVKTGSADSGDSERDDTLRGSQWFDAQDFPVATYESSVFHKANATDFVSEGNLTIRDVTIPVTLPFTLTITEEGDSGKKTATMRGNVTLDRSVLKLGRGDWQDPKSVANNVDVAITVVATSAP